MIEEISDPDLVYASNEPDVNAIRTVYEWTINNLDYYFWQCARSYEERNCWWPGKSPDLRKNGAAAFPWPGASDIEAPVIDERLMALKANCMNAISRSHIRAYGVNTQDINRAQVVSSFLKWLMVSGIPEFKSEIEKSIEHLFEKGLAITYVGWQREMRTIRQIRTLDEIYQVSAELAEMIQEGTDDESASAILVQTFPGLSDKRAKKAVRDLRNTGEAEICFSRPQVDRPMVRGCMPDGDVFFPPYVTDPQQAPYVFWRTWMTAQQIEKAVTLMGWDAQWAEYVILHCRGMGSDRIDGEYATRSPRDNGPILTDNNELVMVVFAYQRLIDDEDGSEGIYLTIFSPFYSGDSGAPGYAKHELTGDQDYPFIATKLTKSEPRLYDLRTLPEMMKGLQRQVKIERDQRIDRSSLSTNPPIQHPAGRPPTQIGPGAMWGYRRVNEVQYATIPQQAPSSIEIEMTMLKQADDLVGLNFENPNYTIRQQYYVDKVLDHVRDVVKMAWKAYQRFGPDSVFFEVVGANGPTQMQKGDADEDFDIYISFDTQWTDPDSSENKLKAFSSLLPLDGMGRIDRGKLIEVMAYAIDPGMASYIIQPADQAQQEMIRLVTDDLSKIYAGVEVGAQPNGSQVALQVIQQWMQQPDVVQRYQADESFKDRVDKYIGQYQMQMAQAQNAEIGRIGTAPAQFQGTNVGAA